MKEERRNKKEERRMKNEAGRKKKKKREEKKKTEAEKWKYSAHPFESALVAAPNPPGRGGWIAWEAAGLRSNPAFR